MALQPGGAWRCVDIGDIRQAIDRCSNIWASLPGMVMVSSTCVARLITKFESGRNSPERLMYEQSHRDYLRSGYLHHRLPVMGCINHYRDNAITYKAQRDKNARELKLANAAITDMQMRQRSVAALDAKYTKELADAKAENDALRDDVAADYVVSLAHQNIPRYCVTLLSMNNISQQHLPWLNTSPSGRGLITMQTTGRNPEVY